MKVEIYGICVCGLLMTVYNTRLLAMTVKRNMGRDNPNVQVQRITFKEIKYGALTLYGRSL